MMLGLTSARKEASRLKLENEKLSAELAAVKAAIGGNAEELSALTEANVQLDAQVSAATAKLAQAESDIATVKASLASVTTAKEKAETELAAAKAIIADPKGHIEAAASAKALEMAAGQGVPINHLPKPGESKAESLDAVREQLKAETDPNKKAILARKARELRGHGDLLN